MMTNGLHFAGQGVLICPRHNFVVVALAACPSTLSGFERRCYRLHRNKISWEEASQNCSLLSTSFLAHPRSMDQLRFIQNLLFRPDLKKSFFSWVGVHDKDVRKLLKVGGLLRNLFFH